MPIFGGFSKQTLKAHLAMGKERIAIMKNKRNNDIKIEARLCADLVSRDGAGAPRGRLDAAPSSCPAAEEVEQSTQGR